MRGQTIVSVIRPLVSSAMMVLPSLARVRSITYADDFDGPAEILCEPYGDQPAPERATLMFATDTTAGTVTITLRAV